MIINFEHEYECEDCGGMFTINPELDEEIKFCPQCGGDEHFKSTFNDIPHDEEDDDSGEI